MHIDIISTELLQNNDFMKPKKVLIEGKGIQNLLTIQIWPNKSKEVYIKNYCYA